MIEIIVYIILGFCGMTLIPIFLSQCTKWIIMGYYRGKEAWQNREPDTRTTNDKNENELKE